MVKVVILQEDGLKNQSEATERSTTGQTQLDGPRKWSEDGQTNRSRAKSRYSEAIQRSATRQLLRCSCMFLFEAANQDAAEVASLLDAGAPVDWEPCCQGSKESMLLASRFFDSVAFE